MLLHPSWFRRFPVATHQSRNCREAKNRSRHPPTVPFSRWRVHRYPLEVLQGDGTGQGHGFMFTARGFGHLINNTVREQVA